MNRISLAIKGLMVCVAIWSCKGKEKMQYTHDFKVSSTSLGEVLTYETENGIKVYLKVDKTEPKISTNIAFKVGSKNDPEDYTGLAHYLEHMLFKGTSKLGSLDWEKEKILLDSIADLYEIHHDEQDPEKRKEIYKEIDRISTKAGKYAVANEYDKLLKSLGATGTNAYTSNEQTVYVNTIPSTELSRWLKIESERFSELVLRLFHTELEAVYEEYNRAADNDYRILGEKLNAMLFPNHQYGQQTTIGLSEHLKAPSLKQIHQFFNTYYVPNNMGIIMVGDLDPDQTIDLIEENFKNYQPKEVPSFVVKAEEPIKEPQIAEVFGPEKEQLRIGYRVTPQNQKEEDVMSMLDGVFSNGRIGLLDLNLLKDQKIQSAYSYTYNRNDYGTFIISATPKPNQTLEEAKDLLLEQIEVLKKGDFPDWVIPAIIKNRKKEDLEASQYGFWFYPYVLTDLFISEDDIDVALNQTKRLDSITKEDITSFANKYFQNNYVVVYKRTGKSDNVKVDKPEITEANLNQDTSSLFFDTIKAMKETRLKPEFADYSQLKMEPFAKGVEYCQVEADIPELFSMEYIVEIGSNHDLKLPLAVNYSKYLGTDSLTAKELEEAFYRMGVSYYVFAGDEKSYIGISGLKESFEPALKLFEHVIHNLKPDQEKYDNYVAEQIKKRDEAKLNKNTISYGASSYAKYGEFNPFNNTIKKDSLAKIDINELTTIMDDFNKYPHFIYLNAADKDGEMKKTLKKYHKIPSTFNKLPEPIEYVPLDNEKNKVFFVHYDGMTQAFITLQSKGGKYNEKLLAPTRLFNTYFGSGLSSIVFQRIRESKALAYSAYAYYSNPWRPKDFSSVGAFIGTQADKTPEAIKAMDELLTEMPIVESQIEESKEGILKQIESSRTKKSSLIYGYLGNKRMGRDKSVDEMIYPQIKEMTTEDLLKFYESEIQNKNYNYIIIGDRNKLDMNYIKSIGEFKELSLEEIWGE